VAFLIVLVGGVLLTVTGGPEETHRLGITIWTEGESMLTGGMDAIVAGTIEYDSEAGCFLLREGESASPVAFPPDTWLISADPIQLLIPGAGIVGVGDRVSGGGGFVDPYDDWNVPDACFGAGGEDGDMAFLQRIGP